MSDVVHDRVVKLVGEDGHTYAIVEAHAAEMRGSGWSGWLEFVTADGERIVGPRETTQSKREDVAYWAQGLEPIYLEGALQRALETRVK